MQDLDSSLTPAQRAEILLNRTNVALARSQRLIESWLPPRPDASSAAVTSTDGDNDDTGDENAFNSMSEIAGIGSVKAFAVEDDGVRNRRGGLTKGNERLLETILGRKGARERMKSLGKGAAGAVGGHEAVKKMEGRGGKGREREVKDEDEDEEERDARFGGRKRRRVEDESEKTETPVEDGEAGKLAPTAKRARVERRKPVSYLDELLAGKKNKKNKKKPAGVDAATP
nr:hypothetical protein CFP56_62894 [Quercus suber]